MSALGEPDSNSFRPGQYFTGSLIIRLAADLTGLRSRSLLEDVARAAVPGLGALLTELEIKSAQRLVTVIDLDTLLELERHAADGPLLPQHSLASYWRIDVAHRPEDLREIVEAFSKLPEVDDAYMDIHVVPASVGAFNDPRAASQGYLRPAPEGIDAGWAWGQASGDGRGVGFADVEEGWNLNHEDLIASAPTLASGINRSVPIGNPPYSPLMIVNPNFLAWNHGTGALGVVTGRDNSVGVVGIAPAAGPIRVASVWDGSTPGHVVDALVALMGQLSAGDVVMLELQTARGNVSGWPNNHPIEIKDAERDAIRLAVSARNLVVIAAAGNGGVDLDTYVSPQGISAGKRVLDRSSPDFQDSGTIVVGAATSTVPHRRMDTMENKSNFGSRVDCYAWGENVTTCGAAIIPELDVHANQWYRTDYNATSAATPIIAGAATLLQGMHKASTGVPLTGLQMRALLSDPSYGTAPSPSIAAAKIGVMPDLRKLTTALALTPDVFLRDSIDDDGATRSTGTLAKSPDIIVRNAASPDPQTEFGDASANENRDDLDSQVVATSNATIYLRCRNRGGSDATDVIGRAWWSPPATLVTPDLWSPIGQTTPFTVAANQSLTVSPPITWTNVPQDHVCLIAAVGCSRDPGPPLPSGYTDWTMFEDMVRNWNNIVWRNIIVVPASVGEPIPLWFRMVGGPRWPTVFDFELDQSLPMGSGVILEVPTAIGKELPLSLNLRPARAQSEDHVAFVLPHRPFLQLRGITLPPGSANTARLTITLPSAADAVKGRIILKQRLGNLHVGGLTWRLVDRRAPQANVASSVER